MLVLPLSTYPLFFPLAFFLSFFGTTYKLSLPQSLALVHPLVGSCFPSDRTHSCNVEMSNFSCKVSVAQSTSYYFPSQLQSEGLLNLLSCELQILLFCRVVFLFGERLSLFQ
jgi:hypothetical protein